MKKISMVLLLSLFAVPQRAPAQEKPPLKLIETTPLPGFSGDFDHLTADLKGTVSSWPPKTTRRLKSSTSKAASRFTA
jgi:hypothetical protein